MSSQDIDFVPSWYRQQVHRQRVIRRQYLALAGLFLAMVVWNAFSMRSIAQASAQLAAGRAITRHAQRVCAEFEYLVRRLAEARQAVDQLEPLATGADPAGVLAELSAIIDERITIETLELDQTLDRPELVLEGLAQGPDAIADLLESMGRSKYFTEARLVCSRQVKDSSGSWRFEMACIPVRVRVAVPEMGD